MAVSSYGAGTKTSGVVRILKDLDRDISDRDVLIVEDIVDSGLTLSWLLDNLRSRRPASLEVCALLRKPEAAKVDIPVRYVGFDIPNEFVVGYGLDYAQRYRNLPYVGTLARHVYGGYSAPRVRARAHRRTPQVVVLGGTWAPRKATTSQVNARTARVRACGVRSMGFGAWGRSVGRAAGAAPGPPRLTAQVVASGGIGAPRKATTRSARPTERRPAAIVVALRGMGAPLKATSSVVWAGPGPGPRPPRP